MDNITIGNNKPFAYKEIPLSHVRDKSIIPVTHKVRLTLFIPTLSLYHLLISIFESKREKFIIQDKEFTLWSKKGGFINPNTGKPAFEYGLSSGDKKSPSKTTVFFKPIFGKGTKTITGKVNNITKIGTDIEVNSSYYDLEDIFKLIHEFLKQISGERFYDMIDTKQGKLLNLERHIRYNQEKEPAVREVLRIIHELAATRGEYDIRDTVDMGNTLFYKIASPTYDFIGFTFLYQVDIKSYRFDAYEDRAKEDALRHPKLEVFIGKSKEYPTVAEYETVKAQLDEFLLNLCYFAGLKDEDYIEDAYFKKEFQDTAIQYRPWKPEGYTELHDTITEIKGQLPLNNDHAMLCLAIIATQENGYITMPYLEKISQIPKRSLWRYLKYYKEKGIIQTTNEGVTSIYFPSRIIWKGVKGAIEQLAQYMDFGIVRRYQQNYIKKDLSKGQQDTNLKIIGEVNTEPIAVETKEDAQILSKDLKRLKINRPIFIENVHIKVG
ncbi:DUF7845 domain-containing protein [Candidatus Methanoperedens nitratireducens]|uniref:DUF7845 domain-containing protein n=1 Tax=Candidatus Methanoperedens nitratireducens TaxID=1392998 RepID=A0A284VKQ0_9EURY|nr:hypothetical protein [Candidatus Methanoperedens nitroreducens]SNQ59803.1 hypothetical protein MNV_1360005 [Candidatus Methanoperedens nitroreducens]